MMKAPDIIMTPALAFTLILTHNTIGMPKLNNLCIGTLIVQPTSQRHLKEGRMVLCLMDVELRMMHLRRTGKRAKNRTKLKLPKKLQKLVEI